MRRNFIRRTRKLTRYFKDRNVVVMMCEVLVDVLDHKSGSMSSKRWKQAIINTPGGASVLPYFRGTDKNWYVLMVEQFRPAIDSVTLEAAGGMVTRGMKVKQVMAKELFEEAGIRVNPKSIEMVFKEYCLPQLINSFAWGGIIEIKEYQLPNSLRHGVLKEGEYTVVSVLQLSRLLEERKSRKIKLDLWTSRLIDEVVRKIKRASKAL